MYNFLLLGRRIRRRTLEVLDRLSRNTLLGHIGRRLGPGDRRGLLSRCLLLWSLNSIGRAGNASHPLNLLAVFHLCLLSGPAESLLIYHTLAGILLENRACPVRTSGQVAVVVIIILICLGSGKGFPISASRTLFTILRF